MPTRPLTLTACVLLTGPALAQDTTVTELPEGAPSQIMATEFDLAPFGYETAEFTLSGTATAYTAPGDLAADGAWTTEPGAEAAYITRIFVHRPADPADFNGTVHVEWLNVTGGADNAVSWKFGHVEMLRTGAAYVGVSAQAGGVTAVMEDDAERYADLSHPGDSFSYDIFADAGQAIRDNAGAILPGLTPERLIAQGESQSATRLTTYINGVQMHAPEVYDGFLLLSGFSRPADLSQEPQEEIAAASPTALRDIGLPVLEFETEMEIQLGLAPAEGSTAAERLEVVRQEDGETYRLWELPGGTHVGHYFYSIGHLDDGGDGIAVMMARGLVQPTTDKNGRGSCALPVGADPMPFVYNAALRHLDTWITEGTAPPAADRIWTVGDEPVVARDAYGNALGGIRLPYVEAPAATLNGIGVGEGFCFLNGVTLPFSPEAYRMRYGAESTFLADWTAATDAVVQAGFVLEDDRARLLAVGQAVDAIPVEQWGPRAD